VRSARRTFLLADRLAGRMGPWYRWPLAGLAIGAVPLLVDWGTGWPSSRLVGALLLTPLLLAAIARDSLGRGLGLLVAAYLGHSAVAIALVAHDAGRMASVLPGGEGYWQQSQEWIVTGASPEYDLGWWLPAHCQILGVVSVFTYLSLGFVTLWQGFHEVDLMNFYVGQLLVHSRHPGLALAVGWHPWSLCRGVGFLFLTFEVASFSLARLTGVPLSTPAVRRRRWVVGLSFLLLDGVLKFLLLDTVRGVLAANLL
jgi:hypothetical protein